MNLLTKEILKRLPKIGETSELSMEDVKVPLKLFNPCGVGTWYITEYDPEEKLAFGFANLGDPVMAELGYISLEELEALRLPLGMKIERDIHFGFNHTLKEVVDTVKSGGRI